PDVDQDPARRNGPQLGMPRACIDVAVRVERHLAIRVAAEPDARVGRELLALTAPGSRDVVDHHSHHAPLSYIPPRIHAIAHAIPPMASHSHTAIAPVCSRRRAGPSSSAMGRAVAGTRIPIDDLSIACWPVTGIEGGNDDVGRPIFAASRLATCDV